MKCHLSALRAPRADGGQREEAGIGRWGRGFRCQCFGLGAWHYLGPVVGCDFSPPSCMPLWRPLSGALGRERERRRPVVRLCDDVRDPWVPAESRAGAGVPPGSPACLSVLPARLPSSSECSLAPAPSLPPSPASSEPSVSFLFLFVWRTKAGRAAKGNEFKETAILDFLRTGECAHARRRVCESVHSERHTCTHTRRRRGWRTPACAEGDRGAWAEGDPPGP